MEMVYGSVLLFILFGVREVESIWNSVDTIFQLIGTWFNDFIELFCFRDLCYYEFYLAIHGASFVSLTSIIFSLPLKIFT